MSQEEGWVDAKVGMAQQQPAETPPSEAPTAPPDEDTADAGAALDPDLRLFGEELYAFVARQQPVRLDPSIGVVQFRQQRDRLHKLGYVFGSKLKTWFHGEVPGEAR